MPPAMWTLGGDMPSPHRYSGPTAPAPVSSAHSIRRSSQLSETSTSLSMKTTYSVSISPINASRSFWGHGRPSKRRDSSRPAFSNPRIASSSHAGSSPWAKMKRKATAVFATMLSMAPNVR